MNNNVLIGGVLAIVLILVGAFMFSNRATAPVVNETSELSIDDEVSLQDDTIESTGTTSVPVASVSGTPLASVAPTTSGAPVAGEVKTFAVAATSFKFTPAEMRVKQGDTVRITLTNNSPHPHDWKLDAFSAATKTIQNGEQDTVEFVANKAGTYEYYCSVGNHRAMGMIGKLIVE